MINEMQKLDSARTSTQEPETKRLYEEKLEKGLSSYKQEMLELWSYA